MFTTIQKWGNSQGVRIPKYLLEQVGLNDDEKIELIADNEQIIIKKAVTRKHVTLDELFKGYDGDYDCREFNWSIDEPVGRELW